MARVVKLAVIPGDGIGPEVIAEAEKVLDSALRNEGVILEKTHFSLGATRYMNTGEILTDADLADISHHDAILLGAVGGTPGDPRLAGANIERELLLRLRFSLDHYVNLRPAVLYPGVRSPLAEPGMMDVLVVREGTEGPYVGNGGSIRTGTVYEVANEVSVNTAFGVERVVRFAFERASARRGHLTLVHKTNVLTFAGALWTRIVNDVASDFPHVTTDYMHVDAATIFLVNDPSRFDVIVTDNLFGDILTDLAAAISGGIGLAASANINAEGVYPSMFEPVHGSAPDIAGQQKSDPTATILSAALMLEHLGLLSPAKKIHTSVAADLADRVNHPARETGHIGDAIIQGLQ